MLGGSKPGMEVAGWCGQVFLCPTRGLIFSESPSCFCSAGWCRVLFQAVELAKHNNGYKNGNRLIYGDFLYLYSIMLRQIITPLEPTYTLQLPKDMMGKTIEILAFELMDQAENNVGDKMLRLKRIEDLTKDKLVDLSNFRFNRNDANNYDD